MTDVYSPKHNGFNYAAPVDPSKCRASVSNGPRTMCWHQCDRRHVRDGWCKQHHPDAEAARRKAVSDRYEAKWAPKPCPNCASKDEEITRLREAATVMMDLLAYYWKEMLPIGDGDLVHVYVDGDEIADALSKAEAALASPPETVTEEE